MFVVLITFSLHLTFLRLKINVIFLIFFSSLLSTNSINFDKLVLELINTFDDVKLDSILKRISRFFNNPNNDFHSLLNSVIKHTLSNYKVKHTDNRVYIVFNHMFVREKFTIFMLSLKICKQVFPCFFSAFNGKNKENHSDAFKLKNIKLVLYYVHNLIKSIDPNVEIIFLADRWFGNYFPLFNFINNELHDYFVFRCKDNFKVYYYDIKEGHKIWVSIHQLPSLKTKYTMFPNLEFTKQKLVYNLTICKSIDHKERWFLISNVDPARSKKYYSYRFGGIETIFKNQKSNGFYLEKTGIKHLQAFDNLYSLLCIATCYYICLGTEISKNSNCYKNIGFRTTRKNKNGRIVRIISLFQAGLKLFKLAFNSTKYYRLPFAFKLYDI